MNEKQPILSICIPIYNRIDFLKRHLEQYIKCKALFEKQIHLFISDNCSSDDLYSVVEKYKNLGLTIDYSRNTENIGPDRNFIKCFNSAKGKYIWLLGSDDIPVDGFVETLVKILEKHDYGYLFLNHNCDDKSLREYDNPQDLLAKVHVWITFMSANIIKTEYVKNVIGEDYFETYLIQVPYFLEGIVTGRTNAVYNYSWMQKGNDSANNGGYNLFKVFVDNLLAIIQKKVESHQINSACYEQFKRSIYCNFIRAYVFDLLISRNKRKRGNFDTTDGWKILMKHYGTNFYFYLWTGRTVLSKCYHKILDSK